MYFGAVVSNTALTFAPASRAVHTQYTISGVSTQCAHSVVMSSLSGAAAFLVAVNNEIAVAGSNADTLKCLENVQSVAHDDAAVSKIVSQAASVPSAILVALQAVCTVSEVSQTTYETLVGPTGASYFYATSINDLPINNAKDVLATSYSATLWIDNCGSFYSCANTLGRTSNIKTFFFNLTSTTRSANVDVWTPSLDDNNRFFQYGNETYVRVIDKSRLRDKCDAPIVGNFDTRVTNYNIVNGGSAVVAVSWSAERPNWPNAIKIRVRYNGPSNSAPSSAMVSAPLLVLAAIVAALTQRFF
jgi:hypothetical protein